MHVEAFSLETHLNTKVQDKPCSGILCGNAPGTVLDLSKYSFLKLDFAERLQICHLQVVCSGISHGEKGTQWVMCTENLPGHTGSRSPASGTPVNPPRQQHLILPWNLTVMRKRPTISPSPRHLKLIPLRERPDCEPVCPSGKICKQKTCVRFRFSSSFSSKDVV